MNTYLIEPLGPLVFRSGKPFGSQSTADGANFPLPSSMAGMLRTVTADQKNQAFNDSLKQQSVYGPLLVRYQNDKTLDVLVPKPADAVYFKNSADTIELVRLNPLVFAEGCESDLPNGLLPVQMEQKIKGKPATGAQYWSLKDLIEWQHKKLDFTKVETNGLSALPTEQRTHVALNDTTLASDDGRLFQTAGLDFQSSLLNKDASKNALPQQRLGFIAQTNAALKEDLVTLGGERRLSRLIKLDNKYALPTNQKLAQEVNAKKGLKLTLLTPAIFAKGYLPQWLDSKTLRGICPLIPNVTLTLRAVAIDRWLPVSGWDLAQYKPKAMRKAVAAGAVYWFAVEGDIPKNLHELLCFKPLSDDTQDQKDGFGLMLPAAWQAV